MGNETSTVGRQAINLVLEMASAWDSVSLEERGSVLVITPAKENTFAVTLYDKGEDCMVTAERWHSHFDDPTQAAFCAAWLLTPFYRICHELKGGILAAVWLERYEIDHWEGMDPVYFLNPEYPPEWELPPGMMFTQRYYQQNVIPPPVELHRISNNWKLENQLPTDSKIGISFSESSRPLSIDLVNDLVSD